MKVKIIKIGKNGKIEQESGGQFERIFQKAPILVPDRLIKPDILVLQTKLDMQIKTAHLVNLIFCNYFDY